MQSLYAPFSSPESSQSANVISKEEEEGEGDNVSNLSSRKRMRLSEFDSKQSLTHSKCVRVCV